MSNQIISPDALIQRTREYFYEAYEKAFAEADELLNKTPKLQAFLTRALSVKLVETAKAAVGREILQPTGGGTIEISIHLRELAQEMLNKQPKLASRVSRKQVVMALILIANEANYEVQGHQITLHLRIEEEDEEVALEPATLIEESEQKEPEQVVTVEAEASVAPEADPEPELEEEDSPIVATDGGASDEANPALDAAV